MKRFFTNKFVLFFLGVLFVLLLWFIISLIFDKQGGIFPSPFLTIAKFFDLLKEPYTYACLGYSLLRMFIGFLGAFLLALLVGVIAGHYPYAYQFLKPLMVAIKSIPTAALVFLFIVLVAPKHAPILVVFVISFPILYEGVVGGVKNIDKDIIEASKVDGAYGVKSITHIKLPLAIPYIVVALISSFALSFKIEIMAEVITGYTSNGLGSVIKYQQNADPTNMETIFAYALFAVIIMLLVSLLEEIFTQLLKKQSIVNINNN